MTEQADNTADNTADTKTRQEKPTKKAAGRRAAWLALLFLLITLLAAASAGYLWLELREFRAARAWNSEQVRSLEADFSALRSTVIPRAALEQRLAAADTTSQQLQDQLARLQKNINRLRQLTQGGQQAWQRAQINYLLHRAQDELLLAGNSASALAALQAADRQLSQSAGPQLHTLRVAIHDDIAALQALPKPDITGMALTLNALAARVNGLPLQDQAQSEYLRADEQLAAAEQGFWQQLWGNLKNSFSTMISVRRTQTPVKPLLTANQEALVYQQLALHLHTARLALLKHDYENFRASLLNAQSWLNRWFDISHSAVQAFLNDIDRLLETPLPAELPTLSSPQTMENLLAGNGEGSQ